MARTLLMVTRHDGPDREAEPVVVDTDTSGVVVVELDDGLRLEFDEGELRAAIVSRRQDVGRQAA
jgi:hypothetical protein